MDKSNFWVEDYFETRSDNPNLILYSVFFNHQRYILCYDKEQLREVYFMERFKNYFMSCRTDFKTISHYYISRPYIRRYEQGICNRIYTSKSSDTCVCRVDGAERVYISFNRPIQQELRERFYADLTLFMTEFNKLGLDSCFAPVEPL